jgi:hypothetical protein
MTNTIDGIKYTALLTAAATLGGGAYSYWTGTNLHGALVVLAAGLAMSSGVTAIAKLGQATRRHELGWGWWLNIPAAAVAGTVLGMIAAPVLAGDIEAAVFMVLLAGWVPVLVVLWIALTTTLMATRKNLKQRRSMANIAW